MRTAYLYKHTYGRVVDGVDKRARIGLARSVGDRIDVVFVSLSRVGIG